MANRKRKTKCKKCGAECCTCTGCDPNKYIDGLCPVCQKIEKQDAIKYETK